MALPYKRSFNAGHQSELIYNEKLHKEFKSIEHLLDQPEKNSTPTGELDGELWLKRPENELKTFDRATNTWKNIFASKFQITDQILYLQPPASPVLGQLWLYQGVLLYFDGAMWQPVKTLLQDNSQFNLATFSNFIMLSPVFDDKEIMGTSYSEKLINDMYLLGKLDKKTDSRDLASDGFYYGSDLTATADDPTLENTVSGVRRIFLPDIDIDRMFLDHDIDFQYRVINQICIEYDAETFMTDDIIPKDKTPTLIHVNPGRITKITKTLFRFDRNNPMIYHSAADTEFYGYHNGNKLGDLLLP